MFNPTIFTGTFIEGWDLAQSASRNNYDAVDLVFGQKMQFGYRVTLRPFGGLRYAAINLKTNTVYEVATPDGLGGIDSSELRNHFNSKFQGLGTRAGFDGAVRLGKNFSLVGRVGAALLGGNIDESMKLFVTAFDASVPTSFMGNLSRLEVNSPQASIIPELDLRIGVDFLYPVTTGVAFNMQIGYDVTHYFDVKDMSLVSYLDAIGHRNDFAIQGAYVRFQVHLI